MENLIFSRISSFETSATSVLYEIPNSFGLCFSTQSFVFCFFFFSFRYFPTWCHSLLANQIFFSVSLVENFLFSLKLNFWFKNKPFVTNFRLKLCILHFFLLYFFLFILIICISIARLVRSFGKKKIIQIFFLCLPEEKFVFVPMALPFCNLCAFYWKYLFFIRVLFALP